MSKNYSDHEGPLDPQSFTDEDVIAAMKQISGYLDTTPQDFKQRCYSPRPCIHPEGLVHLSR